MYTKHYQHKHHLFQYIILLLLLLTGFFAFIQLGGDQAQQIKIAAVTALAYAVWGCFHHLYDQDLNLKIVVEYSTFAVMGVALLWILLMLT